ncbi:MAG: ribbon-helix-helix protein, CopG family [Vicinamibacterales bacterium]
MPTTVHIPDPLLKSVDRRAKALGISRNRLVVRAPDCVKTPGTLLRHVGS